MSEDSGTQVAASNEGEHFTRLRDLRFFLLESFRFSPDEELEWFELVSLLLWLELGGVARPLDPLVRTVCGL